MQVIKKVESYLILGIGTDIGKTFLVENICRNFRKEKIPVLAIKPIVSGFNDKDKHSDSVKILSALGVKTSSKSLDSISPWRFKNPISPHLAAKSEKAEISFSDVKEFCLSNIAQAKKQKQILLIEAAGGVMTPINDEKTFLDLATELKIPVLLVTGNYLGSISHTLCTFEALRSRKVTVEKIIVNDFILENEKSSSISLNQVITTIGNFTKTETISLKNFFKSFLNC